MAHGFLQIQRGALHEVQAPGLGRWWSSVLTIDAPMYVCICIYIYIVYNCIYIYYVLKQWAILWVPHNIPTIPNYIKWAWKPEFLNSGKPQVAKMLPKWHPPKSSNIYQKEVPVVESSRQTILRWWNGSNRRCCRCRFHPCWYTYLPLWKIWTSVGMITFPSEWKNNPVMFQSPPTRYHPIKSLSNHH